MKWPLYILIVSLGFGVLFISRQSLNDAPVEHVDNTPSGAMGIRGSENQGNMGDSGTEGSSPSSPTTTEHTETLNIHAIPLGDGKVSTSPKAGYVFSCQTSFRGGGAEHAGDWISGSTWDLTKKISVLGNVLWPSAVFSTYLEGVERMLKGDGLPVGSSTGIFPIQQNDPAYEFDRNPNSIKEYTVSILIPANPTMPKNASCVPMGPIGYALNGVAIYNALDDAGRDAVAHEVQDSCNGHPQGAGQYHYHGPSDCIPHADENNAVIGFALDGFPITSMYDASGREYTNADLDVCHGTTSEIVLDGKKVTTYHYVVTQEYPYTIGCFRGTPVSTGTTAKGSSQQAGGSAQGGGNTPPPEAVNACVRKSQGASCSFGPVSGGTCRTTPDGSFACVPQ